MECNILKGKDSRVITESPTDVWCYILFIPYERILIESLIAFGTETSNCAGQYKMQDWAEESNFH